MSLGGWSTCLDDDLGQAVLTMRRSPRWFHFIEAKFAATGIQSQNFRYANALANLPKQILRDILDTVNACNDSA
jgi:hypothetical protein